jgi:hypothetical protein
VLGGPTAIAKVSPTGVSGERGLGPGREVDLRETLEGLLPDVGAVRVVLEDDGHDGQAEDRDRAHGGPVGNAVHLVLDRDRHQPLHFFRGVAGEERDDLDLDIRDVGIRLHGQAPVRRHAHRDEQAEQGEDEHPLPEAEGDDRPQGRLASAHAASRSRLPCVTTRAVSARPDSTGTLPRARAPPTPPPADNGGPLLHEHVAAARVWITARAGSIRRGSVGG